MVKATRKTPPGRPTYTPAQRVAAVEIFILCHYCMAEAVKALTKEWCPQWGKRPAAMAEFIERSYTNFKATGSAAARPRPGRPPKMPQAEAKRAAKIFQRGLSVKVPTKIKGIKETVNQLWSSVKEACKSDARLAAVCQKFSLNLDRRKADGRAHAQQAGAHAQQAVAELRGGAGRRRAMVGPACSWCRG
jgi:hypothetical protein